MNERAVHTVELPKNTLESLLSRLTAIDDELIDLDLDEQVELMEQGKVKVDNYKYIVDRMDAQADLYKKWAEEHSKAEKALRIKRKQLLNHLLFSLQKNGFQKFTGNKYQVTIRKARPAVELKVGASALLKIRHPELIKTAYSWDKTEIGKRLKEGDESLAEIAALKETHFAHFSIAKELH